MTNCSKLQRAVAGLILILLVSYLGARAASAQIFGSVNDRVSKLEERMDFRDAELRPLLSNLLARVDQLEADLREARGQIERLKQENNTLRRVFTDPGSSIPKNNSLPNADLGKQIDWRQESSGLIMAPVNGTEKPAGEPDNANQASTQSARFDDPEKEYRAAMQLLRQGRYKEAEVALESFSKSNGRHARTADAKFWLGEARMISGDTAKAAQAFLQVFSDHPDSPRAPESMLKLGLSLLKLGRKEDACLSLLGLSERYPNAEKSLRDNAEAEAQRAKCPI